MNLRQPMIAVGLLFLLFIAIAGLLLTDQGEQATFSATEMDVHSGRFLVDEEPVLTARAVAHFAVTPDERVDAEEALQYADDEVETAFADALRDVQQHPVAPTPESKALTARVEKASNEVAEDQKQVDTLTKQLAQVRDAKKDAIQSELEVAQAQWELDQDDLQDAKQDFLRATGDPSRIAHRIERQLERHKLFEQHGLEASGPESASSDAGYDAGNLVAQVSAWYTLARKSILLSRAIGETKQMWTKLSQAHGPREKEAEGAVRRGGAPPSGRTIGASSRSAGPDPQALEDLTKRMGDEEDLEATYSEWLGFVEARQRVAQRGMVRSFYWVMFIIACVFLAERTVGYYVSKASQNHPHMAHLNAVSRFAVQASGVLLVLIVALGFPQHVPEAIFGVVGAGVTIALKDFSGSYIDSRIRGLLGASAKQESSGE